MNVYILAGNTPYDHQHCIIGVYHDSYSAHAAKEEFEQYHYYDLYVEEFMVE